MNQTEILIIGQGIAGTILSYRLKLLGIPFTVIDEPRFSRSSRIAAGLVNPVVLKRQKWVQGAELFTQNLADFYLEMEAVLDTKFFHPSPIYHLFQSVGEINDWQHHSSKAYLNSYLGSVENKAIPNIHSPFGYGKVNGVFWVNTDKMISAWRDYLKAENLLIEEDFSPANYPKHLHIYCTGHLLTEQFPSFTSLFTKTKGQVMVIESDDLNSDYGLHSSVFTLPLGNNRYKVGATYEHKNLNDTASPEGLSRLQSDLEKFFTGKYTVTDHLAGVRPNVKDRKPLLGKIKEQSFCFNGLGSRGVLMAPYLSRHLIDNIMHSSPILPAWNINRFN
jgi:glycine/D-amino acid oxidase-like deaminating enzyme